MSALRRTGREVSRRNRSALASSRQLTDSVARKSAPTHERTSGCSSRSVPMPQNAAGTPAARAAMTTPKTHRSIGPGRLGLAPGSTCSNVPPPIRMPRAPAMRLTSGRTGRRGKRSSPTKRSAPGSKGLFVARTSSPGSRSLTKSRKLTPAASSPMLTWCPRASTHAPQNTSSGFSAVPLLAGRLICLDLIVNQPAQTAGKRSS